MRAHIHSRNTQELRAAASSVNVKRFQFKLFEPIFGKIYSCEKIILSVVEGEVDLPVDLLLLGFPPHQLAYGVLHHLLHCFLLLF